MTSTSDADLFLQCLTGEFSTLAAAHPQIVQLVSEAKSNRLLAKQRAPTAKPKMQWDLARSSIAEALFKISQDKASGFLVAQKGNDWKVLACHEGVVKNAHSSDSGELLGQMLLQENKISQANIAAWIDHARRENKPVGWALLHVLSADDLLKAMEHQTLQRILHLFGWSQGELAFFDDPKALELAPALNVSPLELIQRSVLQLDFAAVQKEIDAFLQDNKLLCLGSTFEDSNGVLKASEQAIYELLWNSVYAHELKTVIGNSPDNYYAVFMFERMGMIVGAEM